MLIRHFRTRGRFQKKEYMQVVDGDGIRSRGGFGRASPAAPSPRRASQRRGAPRQQSLSRDRGAGGASPSQAASVAAAFPVSLPGRGGTQAGAQGRARSLRVWEGNENPADHIRVTFLATWQRRVGRWACWCLPLCSRSLASWPSPSACFL